MYKHKQRHNPHGHVRPLPPDKLEKLLHGEPIPDQLTRQRLEETRKGPLIMPSLKDALHAALQRKQNEITQDVHATIAAWETDEQPQPATTKEQTMSNNFTPKPRNGVSMAVFDYVLNHPNCTRTQLRDGIVNAGYKESSVSSLLTQNIRAGYFQEIEGKLTTTMTEYKPVSYKIKLKGASKKVYRKSKPRTQPSVEAVMPEVKPVAPSAPAVAVHNDVDYILSTLPIKQARALYDELHKIFG